MAPKNTTTLALFLLLDILLFSSANACGGGCPTPNRPPNPTPNQPPNPIPNPPPNPIPNNPPSFTPPFTPPTPSNGGSCPTDALKLGICATVLNPLLNLTIGTPPVEPCCSLIQGLVDLEAALCLCLAIRANILGINLNIPLSLSLLLNVCDRQAPNGFQCP